MEESTSMKCLKAKKGYLHDGEKLGTMFGCLFSRLVISFIRGISARDNKIAKQTNKHPRISHSKNITIVTNILLFGFQNMSTSVSEDRNMKCFLHLML